MRERAYTMKPAQFKGLGACPLRKILKFEYFKMNCGAF